MTSEAPATINQAALTQVSAKDLERYRTLVDNVADLLRGSMVQAVDNYWKIGKQYVEFEELCQRTGNALTHQMFLADLEAKGHPIGSSTLHHARNLVKRYPDKAQVTELCKRGLTMTHIKALLSVEPTQLTELQRHLQLPDGSVISTRALQTLIDEQRKESVDRKLLSAQQEAQQVKDDKPAKGKSDSDDLFGDDAPTQVGFGDETPAQSPKNGKDKGKESAPAESPRGESKTTKGFTKSPIGVFKGTDKKAYQLLEQLADAVIALREMSQIGYDSDKAHDAAKAAMRDMQSTLDKLQETTGAVLDQVRELGKDA